MKQIIIHLKNTDRVEVLVTSMQYKAEPHRVISWTGHTLLGQPNLLYIDFDDIAAIVSYDDPDLPTYPPPA